MQTLWYKINLIVGWRADLLYCLLRQDTLLLYCFTFLRPKEQMDSLVHWKGKGKPSLCYSRR